VLPAGFPRPVIKPDVATFPRVICSPEQCELYYIHIDVYLYIQYLGTHASILTSIAMPYLGGEIGQLVSLRIWAHT